ncbi:MAG: LacI family transcriptional regulator [Synergistaceae bacterium]|jgi:LacI family transcriptional regulator|nr:LacI family transcriptional regulator [Synergistaceae bacterium]
MADNNGSGGSNITIKSIAKEIGLSFSTVSKALNGSSLVKEETRASVLEKAREMGYSPNMLARGLRKKTTKSIGVIFNDVENTVWIRIFKKISIEMAKYGYTTLIGDGQFDQNIERSHIMSFLSRMPDFVILSPSTASTDNLALFADMTDRLIVLGERIPNINCHYVDVDYATGGYMSASELLENGHTDNIIFTVPPEFPISTQYVQGIMRAYSEYGVPFEKERLIYKHTSIDSGYSSVMDLWDAEKEAFSIHFTGVMVFCDLMAHGIYKALRKLGKRIPEDISVIGHDDNPLSEFSKPPLTTVCLPTEKMTESCLAIIKSVLIDDNKEICHYFLDPTFVRRESVIQNSKC